MNNIEEVNILLATYKPDFLFLEKQLESLDNQTYKELIVSIIDDSDDFEITTKIRNIVEDKLRNVKYEFEFNKVNIGSNRTFEKLTKNSNSKYVAYCDQDDIWEHNKVEKLVNVLKKNNSLIAYSDLAVINSQDEIISSSFKNLNPRLIHVYGKNQFEHFLTRNSITGCTLLMERRTASKHIPFMHDFFVHDHWLALVSASEGEVSYINEPLIKYRLHDNNQIGSSLLKNINNKKDYKEKKIKKEIEKLSKLEDYQYFSSNQKEIIRNKKELFLIKNDFFEKPNLKNIWRLFILNKKDIKLVLFEYFIGLAPQMAVNWLFKAIKK